ncbi:hypothetical protein GGS23DRAFT_605705 [Durotheca rogersii]|uniref:uncharacterized protein n=1 Tax=Durotheca rogersii TaxID=419775 RepID=UPI0022202FD6|nr:uncharacterized protein GGS23DRAFT_605705 [Durotheca rogersii]KAI5862414.1 hypothetical protein GGS23DRAFT_605705 [Durotheca rogersii]
MRAFGLFGRISATATTAAATTAAISRSKTTATATAASRLVSLSRHFSSTPPIMAPISKEIDLLVIGGGSGGLGAARMASGKFGAKAMIVEAQRLGGTCVNVGCVPKKVTFNAAAIAEAIRDSKAYGFSVEEAKPFDFGAFKRKRDAYVKRLNGIYERNLANDKIEYVHGRARLLSRHEVEIALDDGSTATVRANRIVVAVGGEPARPPADIPGAELGTDSDGFFDIDALPRRVAIVGSGYIGVEFAGMFNALGVETHLFIRHQTVLRAFDPMIQEGVTAEYERLGVRVHKESALTRVERDPATGALTIAYRGPAGEATLDGADHLIWAIGRTPLTRGLGLEEAGVRLDAKGHVVVDEFQNTSVDNIFALGDVAGRVELTPVAIAAGRRLAERLYGGAAFAAARISYEDVPSVVFAHPEVGSVGLTEPQAEARYGRENLTVYRTSFTAMYYAMMEPEHKAPTRYKVVCAGPEQRVVGLHIMGLGSGEMLQGFGVAVKMGATKKDLDACIAIHPTSAEELVTLK